MNRFIKKLLEIRLNRFYKRFIGVEYRQRQTLERILKAASGTKYLIDNKVVDLNSFHKNIPINTYSDLEAYIDNDFNEYSKSIIPSRPVRWEKTSGSSGKNKNIAYTKTQIRVLIDYLFIWFSDVVLNGPKLKSKKLFYSLSAPTSEAGEFEDDLDYIPSPIRKRIEPFIVNPKGMGAISDPYTFKLKLCSALVSARDLEIIFIWSPSYLLSLIDFISKNKKEIQNNIGKELPELDSLDFEKLWPDLKLISCWTDGSAALFMDDIRKLFPDTEIQGKGLISTESAITIPLFGHESALPLVNEVFYEFIDQKKEVKLLHELEHSEEYEMLITTVNGLYRYKLGDRVQVSGFINEAPCLRFLGRAGKNVDLTGEKFSEELALDTISKLENVNGVFVPNLEANNLNYYFIYESSSELDSKQVEELLMDNFHYQQSRFLGQLARLEVLRVDNLMQLYQDFYKAKGMIEGNIKFSPLITDLDDAKSILSHIKASC